jgi:hypothetical protein
MKVRIRAGILGICLLMKDRFMGSIEVVIKSMYHRELLDIDVLFGIKTGCIFWEICDGPLGTMYCQ